MPLSREQELLRKLYAFRKAQDEYAYEHLKDDPTTLMKAISDDYESLEQDLENYLLEKGIISKETDKSLH